MNLRKSPIRVCPGQKFTYENLSQATPRSLSLNSVIHSPFLTSLAIHAAHFSNRPCDAVAANLLNVPVDRLNPSRNPFQSCSLLPELHLKLQNPEQKLHLDDGVVFANTAPHPHELLPHLRAADQSSANPSPENPSSSHNVSSYSMFCAIATSFPMTRIKNRLTTSRSTLLLIVDSPC